MAKDKVVKKDFTEFFESRRVVATLDELKKLSEEAYLKNDMKKALYYKSRYYNKQKKLNEKNKVKEPDCVVTP